jgi:hypothetical protein
MRCPFPINRPRVMQSRPRLVVTTRAGCAAWRSASNDCGAGGASGGAGVTTNYYRLGADGAKWLYYNAYSQADTFDVYSPSGVLLATTGGPVSGTGILTWTQTERGKTRVVVTGDPGTIWNYTIGCGDPPT